MRGCNITDVLEIEPWESRAVRISSRWEGYSWSGAENEPLATPSHVWIGCVWQLDGQWCMTSDQERRRARQRAVLGSVAEPENEICWPTRQVVDELGALMTGVGG